MGFLGWIVLGLIAGWIAGIITGRRGQGCLTTIAVGILGALIGGVLANAAGYNGTISDLSVRSVVIAVLGAVLLLFLFNAIRRR